MTKKPKPLRHKFNLKPKVPRMDYNVKIVCGVTPWLVEITPYWRNVTCPDCKSKKKKDENNF